MHAFSSGLKPIGPIDPNWALRWSYILSTVEEHTTSHCRFNREQHRDPHLLRPALHLMVDYVIEMGKDIHLNVVIVQI